MDTDLDGRVNGPRDDCSLSFPAEVRYGHPVYGLRELISIRCGFNVANIIQPEGTSYFVTETSSGNLELRFQDNNGVIGSPDITSFINVARLIPPPPPPELRFPVCISIGNFRDVTEFELRNIAAGLGINPNISIPDLQRLIEARNCVVTPPTFATSTLTSIPTREATATFQPTPATTHTLIPVPSREPTATFQPHPATSTPLAPTATPPATQPPATSTPRSTSLPTREPTATFQPNPRR